MFFMSSCSNRDAVLAIRVGTGFDIRHPIMARRAPMAKKAKKAKKATKKRKAKKKK